VLHSRVEAKLRI